MTLGLLLFASDMSVYLHPARGAEPARHVRRAVCDLSRKHWNAPAPYSCPLTWLDTDRSSATTIFLYDGLDAGLRASKFGIERLGVPPRSASQRSEMMNRPTSPAKRPLKKTLSYLGHIRNIKQERSRGDELRCIVPDGAGCTNFQSCIIYLGRATTTHLRELLHVSSRSPLLNLRTIS